MDAIQRAKLEEIIRVVLDLPRGSEVEDLVRKNTSSWDSLAQATLIAALEDEFGIAFDIAEYEALETFPGIVATVAAKLG